MRYVLFSLAVLFIFVIAIGVIRLKNMYDDYPTKKIKK